MLTHFFFFSLVSKKIWSISELCCICLYIVFLLELFTLSFPEIHAVEKWGKIKNILLRLIGVFAQIDYSWNKHLYLVIKIRRDSGEFYLPLLAE